MDKIAKIILHKDNKFLLQLRDNKPTIDFPNTWSLIGGYIEKNENALDCIIRETYEEIHLKLKQEEVTLISTKIKTETHDNIKFEENIFSAELTHELADLQLHEGRDLQLFSLMELDDINIRPVFKNHIIEFSKHIKK